MKKVFMLVLAVGLAAAYPADEVFRYADEDTKQSHYMEGEPGVNVNGGWEFESPEGRNYMLTYKANEMGFQPEADYLPLQVDDTNEVAEAKANFYQLFEEARKNPEEEVEATTAVQEEGVARSKRQEEVGAAEVAEAVTEAIAEAIAEAGPEARAEPEMAEPEMAVKNTGNYFYFNQMMPGSYGYQKSPVNAPKLVFHPYYGFIPATPKKEEAKEEVMDDVEKKAAAKMAYVFDPYYGYIPYVAKKDEAMEKKEQQMFEYHPYYGYIPYVAKKDGEMAKEETEMKAEKLVYHPYYGFIRMSQLKGMEKEVKENQMYVFDPFYGYIPVAKKAEEVKEMEAEMEKEMEAEEMVKAAEEVVEEVKEMVAEEVVKKAEEEAAVEAAVEEVKEEMKDDDAHKFYFHPYYGFIPVSKLTDEKMRVGVNMEMKYVLHPYFGFVPESQKIEQKKLTMPYNPFGYKFVPYQPKKLYYTFNTVGDKMKAMAANVEEAQVEAKAEEEVVETRRKRSPVHLVPTGQV